MLKRVSRCTHLENIQKHHRFCRPIFSRGSFSNPMSNAGELGGEAEIQDGAMGGAWVAFKKRVRFD